MVPGQQAWPDPPEAMALAALIHQGQHRAGRMVQPIAQEVRPGRGFAGGVLGQHRPLR
jgi:hypothetical protein